MSARRAGRWNEGGDMTETTRVLLAAESLAERGFLAREGDRRLMDLAVEDRGFRYRTDVSHHLHNTIATGW